jgi:hypothetical protein
LVEGQAVEAAVAVEHGEEVLVHSGLVSNRI